MRLPRVQFTIRWLMASIFLASLVFATVVARREQQRMVPVLNALEASYQNAKLTREVAEIAVMEYADGTYKQDRETLTDLERANARQEWLDQMRQDKSVSLGKNTSDRLASRQAIFTIETACPARAVRDSIREKTIEELNRSSRR